MSETMQLRKEKRDGAGVPYFVLNLGDGRIHELPEAVIDQVLALEERARAAEAEARRWKGHHDTQVEHKRTGAAKMKAHYEAQLTTSESARQAAEGRAALADEAALRLRERDGYDNFFVAEAGFDFKGRPEADLNFTPAYHDWLALYDALSSPVPADRDGGAEA